MPEEQKTRKGCFVWGCITMIALALMLSGVVGLFLLKARRLRDQLTATEPQSVPIAQTPAPKARQLAREYNHIKNAIENGRPTTLRLTAEELNQMIATVPHLKDFKGRAHFSIEDDQIKAVASIPLDQLPGFQGRYLNGNFDLAVRCQNGVLEVYATNVTVKGNPIPTRIMNKLRNQNLAQKLYEDPKTVEKLKNIESVNVENGSLTIVTRGAP